MELTTHLGLQSQTTRLFGMKAYTINLEGDEAITLHGGAFKQHLPSHSLLLFIQQTTILFAEILMMSFSFFTRHY
jgi:hypothetical protein